MTRRDLLDLAVGVAQFTILFVPGVAALWVIGKLMGAT